MESSAQVTNSSWISSSAGTSPACLMQGKGRSHRENRLQWGLHLMYRFIAFVQVFA